MEKFIFILAALLPVYIFANLSAITLTLANTFAILLICALCASLCLAISLLAKGVK
jgi:hypothetical protein